MALPVLVENVLNIAVGLNDAFLGNHLGAQTVDAAPAVGTAAYLLWFIGLFSGALGIGATALISRATGARHQRRANAAVGQAFFMAMVLGVSLMLFFLVGSGFIARISGLTDTSGALLSRYLMTMCWGAPFLVVLFVSNACMRGAGDTIRPAAAMITVNVANIILTWSLTYGYLGLPAMGIYGISLGTAIAYAIGGIMQTTVLWKGYSKARLFLARIRPRWEHLKHLLKVGLPSGGENLTMWGINFFMLTLINGVKPLKLASAAHFSALRIESLSYMTGFAVATATSTLVGQLLGAHRPADARRTAHLAYAMAGVAMTLWGLFFIFFGHVPAAIMSEDPTVRALTARCLLITGFIQWGFAAFIIYSAALRGAGDTFAVMAISLTSMIVIRFGGVWLVVRVWGMGLDVIWMFLAGELLVRGLFAYLRFRQGRWMTVRL